MGCQQSKHAVLQQHYYDRQGGLNSFDPASVEHVASEELQRMQQLDKSHVEAEEEVYLIATAWVDEWLKFATGKHANFPSSIDNSSLVDGSHMRRDVKQKMDFRPVNAAVWQYLFRLYGGAPVLSCVVPHGLDAVQYRNGAWMNVCRWDEQVVAIWPCATQAAAEGQAVPIYKTKTFTNPISEGQQGLAESFLAGLEMQSGINQMRKAKENAEEIKKSGAEAIAASMASDMGKSMMREANKLEEEAKSADAEAVATLFAADMAAQKMKEAKKLEEEANQAAADAIAASMLEDLANAKQKEAAQAEAEANQSVADSIALQMAADAAKREMELAKEMEKAAQEQAALAASQLFAQQLAAQKAREAEEAAEKAKAETAAMAAELFKNMGAKQRFRAAVEAGNAEMMEAAAASMLQANWRSAAARKRAAVKRAEQLALKQESCARTLQATWRAKRARREVLRIRAEKKARMEVAAARRLQNAWRAKLARRKTRDNRERKSRLLEEAAALKLQGAYRARIARRRVIALREERQQKMEEAAAQMMQLAWRRVKSRRRAAKLRDEKDKKREMAAAIMLQGAWRARKARNRVNNLKAERQRLMEEAAAKMFQAAWRAVKAKRKVGNMRKERAEKQQQEAQLGVSATKLANAMRRFQAVRKMAKLRQQQPAVFLVNVVRCEGLTASANSADPYVWVAATGPEGDATICLTKTRVVKDSLNPEFNSTLILGGVTGHSSLVFTVCDSDLLTADDFLGQASINLDRHRDLYTRSEPIEMELPLAERVFALTEHNGKPIRMDIKSFPIRGKVIVRLQVCPPVVSLCGNLLRLGRLKMMATTRPWKRRYMVLAGDRLVYHDDICSQHDITGTIMAADMTSVEESMEGDKLIILITFRTNDKKRPVDDWRIHLSNEQLHETWLRKLRFAASQAAAAQERDAQSKTRKKNGTPHIPLSQINPIMAAAHGDGHK